MGMGELAKGQRSLRGFPEKVALTSVTLRTLQGVR